MTTKSHPMEVAYIDAKQGAAMCSMSPSWARIEMRKIAARLGRPHGSKTALRIPVRAWRAFLAARFGSEEEARAVAADLGKRGVREESAPELFEPRVTKPRIKARKTARPAEPRMFVARASKLRTRAPKVQSSTLEARPDPEELARNLRPLIQSPPWKPLPPPRKPKRR